MLPKVANHLLHHTARAISVAQNQTGQTIRNVLQLQSSSSPSTASGNFGAWNGASSSHSNWNGRGTGSGGAKYHPGGRTYSGYTVRSFLSPLSSSSADHAPVSHFQGAGRAVTQAETASFDDLSQSFGDDSDEPPLALRRSPRAKDAPIPSRSRTSLAVVRSVRAHASSHRPFGPQTALEASSGPGISTQATALLLHRLSSREVSARLHSTAASAETVSEYLDVESPPASSPSLQPSDATLSRAPSPASSLPTPPPEPEEKTPDHESAVFHALREAAEAKDITKVKELVKDFTSRPERFSAQLYNAALSALLTVRPPYQSLRSLIALYNDMIARSVAPNFRTYTTLIRAFTDRDLEIRQQVEQLERRIKRQTTFGGDTRNEERSITALRAEDNLRPALLLFQTASAIPYTTFPRAVHHKLLESCAFHKNVDAAVHVYAHLERSSGLAPSARTYELLMRVYIAVADWNAVKDVFDEFRNACESGRISSVIGGEDADRRLRYSRVLVWNSMIEAHVRSGQHAAALGLLEQMLDTKAGEAYDPAGIPPPSVTTFNRLIESFCESGEIDTALVWFNRLLLQDDGPRPPSDASTTPCRPDYNTWVTMIEALYSNGRIDDLLELMTSLEQFCTVDRINLHHDDVHAVLQAYFRYLSAHADLGHAKETMVLDSIATLISRYGALILTFRVDYGAKRPIEGSRSFDGRHEFGVALAHLLLGRGRRSDAIRFASLYIDYRGKEVSLVQEENPEKRFTRLRLLDDFVVAFGTRCRGDPSLSMQEIADVCELVGRVRKTTPPAFYFWCLHEYDNVRTATAEPPVLSFTAWQTLFRAAARVNSPVAIEDLMEDYARTGAPLTDVPGLIRAYMYRRLVDQKGETQAQEIMARYSRDFEEVLNIASQLAAATDNNAPLTSESTVDSVSVQVDHVQNAFVAQFVPIVRKGISPLAAYNRFDSGRTKGVYPRPETLAQLIVALGRERELEKVQDLYTAAQLVLKTYENEKDYQSHAWFMVEDHMIVALAHGGDVNAAHVHRVRIIEHGGVPSADAYGALVHNVKDTTDDAHNAVALFHEARDRGVTPNIFLYNTMISKLAKARKADDALSLFHEMKASGIRPSSVTYGAVIAACCRVGDVASAETLFAEMSSHPGFRPRVPPYNTMMQLYTTTRPDRARTLHYFDAMLSAGIQPSAHTYKVCRALRLFVSELIRRVQLLLDAYGSIEPVDAVAMEQVFTQVTSGRKPLVQGTHWASLIHSIGCVQKDLDRALALFDSIADHPSTTLSGVRLPDAVVFESLIDVLAAHRRVDLIPHYVSQLHTLGIHMTAYIANLLIKAYASAGGIEHAREIFEGLADPPEGMAALHNHAPHDAMSGDHSQVPVDAPVYREVCNLILLLDMY